MLRNPKGATSLRWLQVLLDGGIEVHGQIVVCPGVNDGAGPRGHAGRDLGPVPGAGQRRRGAARGQPLFERARRCARTRWTRRRPSSTTIERVAGGLPPGARSPHGLRGRRVLPPGGAGLPVRRGATRATPSTRTGSAWRGAFAASFAAPVRRRAGRRAPRLLRLGRRRPRRGLPSAAACPRRRRAPTNRPVTVLTGDVRGPGARAAGGSAPAGTTCRCAPWPTTSSAATSAWRGS